MLIQVAHKIRLCPSNEEEGYLLCACGVSRFTYNWGLAEWRQQYEEGSSPSAYQLKKKFNSIKREEYPFVMEVTKCASEQAFSNLEKAFKGFFRNIKNGKKPGYPRFKRKGIKDSFYLANDQVDFDGEYVWIPKLGWVRMREELRFDGKIMSAIISKTADLWFVSVQVEQEIDDVKAVGPIIGVDVGVQNLARVSDGRVFENPKALKKSEDRIRLLQKSVGRKKKGSNNRKKAVVKLQRQHYRVSCVRKDAIHKATSAIAKGVSAIGIESLNVEDMLDNKRLSKAVMDASMSEFLRQLEYKALWRGISVIKADKYFPSSKKCFVCGEVKSDLKLGDRIYNCDFCGLKVDRDFNAARNLKKMAVGSTVTACRLGSSGAEVLADA